MSIRRRSSVVAVGALIRSLLFAALVPALPSAAAAPVGYYRQPALHGNTIVFVAEGDLWKVSAAGGTATRLTSHPADESDPAISPDGLTVAFVGRYEGPAEVYTMPLAGGLPTRRTYDGEDVAVVGWTRDGQVLCATDAHATLPSTQLVTLDIRAKDVAAGRRLLPLAQAAEGCYDDAGQTLFFTRQARQSSHTKRYQGGTAQNLWKFTVSEPASAAGTGASGAPASSGGSEATPLTASYPGTSKRPMWWAGRVYFASDRDGTMNLWSIKPDGTDLQQHTRHQGWDVMSPSLSQGRIVYQLGADLHLYDIAAGRDQLVPVTLDSDLDQMREHWVKRPLDYLSAAAISPDGDRVVLTARGQVFVVPARKGRLIEIPGPDGVRFRKARFLPDGKTILALSDESGEVELWTLPANGIGMRKQLTRDGDVLRWEGMPSPDGKLIAHHDKNQRLFLYDVAKQTSRQIDESEMGGFADLAWSPDSKWLAYVANAPNEFGQVRLYSVAAGSKTNVTSDRFDSFAPAWSPDGKWLYLLSDRHLRSVVGSPWGSYQPEPFLDEKTQVYCLALTESATRPLFAPKDELHPEKEKDKDKEKPAEGGTVGADEPRAADEAPATQAATQASPATAPSTAPAAPGATQPALAASQPATQPARAGRPAAPVVVKIDLAGIQARLFRVPVPAGNYRHLTATDKGLLWLSQPRGQKNALVGVDLTGDPLETKTLGADVESYDVSQDGKKLLVRKATDAAAGGAGASGGGGGGGGLYVIDTAIAPAELLKKQVDLARWTLAVVPREEWRQMFVEAWRLERDYFYDRQMHGVDWPAMRRKYQPLVERVTTRAELSDLVAQMVSELSALHIFVHGGDRRTGDDRVTPADLGAVLARDAEQGGYRVEHIYRSDPDEPDLASPLRKPDVNVKEGDVIELVNGRPALGVPDLGALLRQRADQQVLLHVKPGGKGPGRDVIVTPLSPGAAANLRYHEWEYTRRLTVEEQGRGEIGYVHLRAMGGGNFTEWAKGFYPVWNRAGLIIDVRHNNGGNIDSWIIGRLLRKAWYFFTQRVGRSSTTDMQYAFRGHVVVLCDEWTCSDGEGFAEGIKRLKLGTVIGTRTWGGGIWLSSSNVLVDHGIATAAEFGMYGPEGAWLVEGHGVDPDIVVDNLPHATFGGADAQLQAGIEYLRKKIKDEPIKPVPVPKYPDKALRPAGGAN